jgi:hypothetical protein
VSVDVAEARDLAAADPGRAASMRALRQWPNRAALRRTRQTLPSIQRFNRIYVDFDSSRFDPLRADEEAWKAVALWRQRMNAATRRPPQ